MKVIRVAQLSKEDLKRYEGYIEEAVYYEERAARCRKAAAQTLEVLVGPIPIVNTMDVSEVNRQFYSPSCFRVELSEDKAFVLLIRDNPGFLKF